MASRRLALNLNQALRSRAALRAIAPTKRSFATPINKSIQTESTTLSNGLTIATEHSPVRNVPSNARQKINADFDIYSVGTNLNVSLHMGMLFRPERVSQCEQRHYFDAKASLMKSWTAFGTE